jgi:hypothetical protein
MTGANRKKKKKPSMALLMLLVYMLGANFALLAAASTGRLSPGTVLLGELGSMILPCMVLLVMRVASRSSDDDLG